MSEQIKVSELVEASRVNLNDYVMIIQNGTNKRVKASEIGIGGGGDILPIGTVVELASNTVPNNWLLCNGQAVSRIEYEDLFEVLGTTWGAGDGSTTFNVPNRAGLIAIGAGTHTDTNGTSKTFVLGQEYGEYNHTLSVAEMPEHRHGFENFNGTSISPTTMRAGGSNELEQSSGSRTYDQLVNSKAGGGQSHNNIQPSQATNFIIKARQSAGVSASVIQEDGTPNETDVYSSEAMQAILAEKGTYSTEEKRVGTWIDGKPTYRKVVTYTLREVHSTGTMGIPHSIQNLKAIINLSTSSSTTDGAGFLFPCGTYQGGNTSVSSYDNQNLYFEIYNDVWSDGRTITIIIEYTKTTD